MMVWKMHLLSLWVSIYERFQGGYFEISIYQIISMQTVAEFDSHSIIPIHFVLSQVISHYISQDLSRTFAIQNCKNCHLQGDFGMSDREDSNLKTPPVIGSPRATNMIDVNRFNRFWVFLLRIYSDGRTIISDSNSWQKRKG